MIKLPQFQLNWRLIRRSVVLLLMSILAGELVLSVRQQSQTWDEACHLLAGYRYWQDSDFGINPEHPPLVKWVATVPLLLLHPPVPRIPQGTSKYESFVAGRKFLFAQDVDALLLRCRVAASLFTLLLALLVFEAGSRMYSEGPAILALLLIVFEPNLLAHGALVTTDVGSACCFFAAVYAFYRYVRQPSALRLAQSGFAAGLTLAAKHSGILILPVLGLLALAEVLIVVRTAAKTSSEHNTTWKMFAHQVIRLGGSLFAVGVIAIAVLWSCYGFRFRARPGGLGMTPPLVEYVKGGTSPGLKNPLLSRVILGLDRWHLLPESYLYGLADVLIVSARAASNFPFWQTVSNGEGDLLPGGLRHQVHFGIPLAPGCGVLGQENVAGR